MTKKLFTGIIAIFIFVLGYVSEDFIALYETRPNQYPPYGKEVVDVNGTKFMRDIKDETNEMLKDKNVIVVLDDTAAQWIADKGFDPAMGARPMQRIFDQSVKRPLSKEILFGKLINGGTVIVKAVNDKLELEYQQ